MFFLAAQKKKISWRAENPLNFGSGMVPEPSQPTPHAQSKPQWIHKGSLDLIGSCRSESDQRSNSIQSNVEATHASWTFA